LSLIIAGSSTNTALGSVLAGGAGTPESDVTHVVLDQPVGSAGGITPSNSSKRSKIGSHDPAATILASATAAAATKNRQKITRSRLRVNAHFGFVAIESAVSLA
jgi:hypothetical protein